jgi:mannose/fructose/N-acetylgalactosamine-specific phosphotransferase system component IIB
VGLFGRSSHSADKAGHRPPADSAGAGRPGDARSLPALPNDPGAAAPVAATFVSVAHIRVDSRLVHGQVICAWVPHLKVKHLVVADDEAAADDLRTAAMELAVCDDVDVRVLAVDACAATLRHTPPDAGTLVVTGDVGELTRLTTLGIAPRHVTIGVAQSGPGRLRVTPSVYLTPGELGDLDALERAGVAVAIQAVPTEAGLTLTDARRIIGESVASCEDSPDDVFGGLA